VSATSTRATILSGALLEARCLGEPDAEVFGDYAGASLWLTEAGCSPLRLDPAWMDHPSRSAQVSHDRVARRRKLHHGFALVQRGHGAAGPERPHAYARAHVAASSWIKPRRLTECACFYSSDTDKAEAVAGMRTILREREHRPCLELSTRTSSSSLFATDGDYQPSRCRQPQAEPAVLV